MDYKKEIERLRRLVAFLRGQSTSNNTGNGLSAYEVAVANGFVGTEQQWLASLVGAQGPAGQNGQQGLQGPAGPDSFLIKAKLANNISTGANVTPVTVTGLSFNFEANSDYLIEIFGEITAAAATTGCGLQFDTSVAVTNVDLTFFHQLANTGTLTGGNSIADNASQGVSSGIPAANGTYPIYAAGKLNSGANAGTAQLMLRSETTAVITLKANTIMRVMKL